MASDITISAFSGVAGVGQVTLAATWAAPTGQSCLPYMQATKVRFFRNTVNNAATAIQIGESTVGILTYATTSFGYYFAAAVDPAGNEGTRSSGILVSPTTAETPDGSITNAKLADNSVTGSKIVAGTITAGKMSVTTLSAITANLGTITAGSVTGITFTGGVFQTAASGRRIEITQSNNQVRAYDNSGNLIGRFGQNTGSDPVVEATSFVSTVAAIRGYGGLSTGACHGGYFENVTGGGLAVIGASPAAGSYAVYAARGGYGPFTGSHDGFVRKGHDLMPGDLVRDVRVMVRNGVNDVVTEVEKCTRRADRRVAGVVALVVPFDPESMIAVLPLARYGEAASFVRRHIAQHYDRVIFNAVGEGQLIVCGRNGAIAAGDYVQASSLAGCAERQSDTRGNSDYRLKAWTVAQIREDVTFDHPDQTKLAACFYRCG